eukprot:1008172-Prymnesium_polylepis.1
MNGGERSANENEDNESSEETLARVNAIIKQQTDQRWARLRRLAPWVGRIAIFTVSLFHWILSPDGPVAKRANIEFAAGCAKTAVPEDSEVIA